MSAMQVRATLGAWFIGIVALLLVLHTSPLFREGVVTFDPDFWWVAAAGRRATLVSPLTENAFSYTAPHYPWVFHEHAFGPAYAWLLTQFGSRSLGWGVHVSWLVTVTTVLVVAIRGVEPRRRFAGLLLVMAWLSFYATVELSPRATVVAWMFPPLVAFLCLRTNLGRGHLFALCALEWVWANAHGSFPLGIALAVLAALERPTARHLIAIPAMVAVTFLNPRGVALHQLVVSYLAGSGTQRVVHQYIVEFRPLFGEPATANVVLAALLFGLACSVLVFDRTARWRAIFCLGLLVLALLQRRHLDLAAPLCAMLLAEPLSKWLVSQQAYSLRQLLFRTVLPAAVATAIGLSVAPGGSIGGRDFLALVDALPRDARVYVPPAFGGVVEWHAAPRGVRVFADMRNDCYPPGVLDAAYRLATRDAVPEAARTMLLASGTTHAILRSDSTFAHRLRGRWRSVERGEWTLFVAP